MSCVFADPTLPRRASDQSNIDVSRRVSVAWVTVKAVTLPRVSVIVTHGGDCNLLGQRRPFSPYQGRNKHTHVCAKNTHSNSGRECYCFRIHQKLGFSDPFFDAGDNSSRPRFGVRAKNASLFALNSSNQVLHAKRRDVSTWPSHLPLCACTCHSFVRLRKSSPTDLDQVNQCRNSTSGCGKKATKAAAAEAAGAAARALELQAPFALAVGPRAASSMGEVQEAHV